MTRKEQMVVRQAFATLRTIARRSGDDIAADVEAYRGLVDDRAGALGRVIVALLGNMEAGIDLAVLVDNEILALGRDGQSGVSVGGGSVRIDAQAAGLLALTIHELLAGAVDRGSLRGSHASISLRWHRENGVPHDFVIEWREIPGDRGDGDAGGWMGTLADAIAYELDGRLHHEDENGTRICRVSLPQRCLVDA